MFNASLPASTTIFWITIAISLIGLYLAPTLIRESLFRPYWFIKKNQFYTIITSGLVHADLGHLLMNMVTFYFFAFPLEARIGTGAFLVLYVLALLLSSVSTWYKHLNDPNYATLGASGAISAILFAFIVYDPLTSLIIFPIPIPIPAFIFGFLYLGYTYWSAQKSGGRINHDAHLWGAITGLLFVLVTDPGAYGRLFAMMG